MKSTLLLLAFSVPVLGGIVVTWLWARSKEQSDIASRLSKLAVDAAVPLAPVNLLRRDERSHQAADLGAFHDLWEQLRLLFVQADLEQSFVAILALSVVLFSIPILGSIIVGYHWLLAVVGSIVLSALPILVVKATADARRQKFCQLLPDAIDLMVAVLRSGHSVPQAVKAVSQELASPIAEEFDAVVNRMNLGQPLYEAFLSSSQRFQSYELELIRVAIAIQSDVGGSLAELLDKTNRTLRERLKLSRQLKVITAQSRLSAHIVGILPIVLALGLNFLSPGYLQLLVENKLGQTLVLVSIVLQAVGIFTMQKMSNMRI